MLEVSKYYIKKIKFEILFFLFNEVDVEIVMEEHSYLL
jgi:hypothetical protein